MRFEFGLPNGGSFGRRAFGKAYAVLRCSNKGKGELISLEVAQRKAFLSRFEEYIEMSKEGQQNIYYFTCAQPSFKGTS